MRIEKCTSRSGQVFKVLLIAYHLIVRPRERVRILSLNNLLDCEQEYSQKGALQILILLHICAPLHFLGSYCMECQCMFLARLL